jgi:anti-sigma B factor antagonist
MYSLQNYNNIILLTFHENLISDMRQSPLFQELTELIEQNFKLCAIDIQKVQYLNSNGLNCLIRILTLFRKEEGEIVLLNSSEAVEKLLIITKLKAIFHIAHSLEEAESFLKKI